MSRSRFAASLLLALALGAVWTCGVAAQAAPRRPNIVVVLVDDAGYADFPHFADTRPRTPHIDRLAVQGLHFTQYYSNAPICSPSRAALVTGRFPARLGITSFIASSEENQRRGIRDWLDADEFTLARALQQAGYATGHFGKWHLGGGRDVGDAPLIKEYGFDASLTQFEGLGDRVLPLMPDGNGAGSRKLPLGRASEQLGHGNVTWTARHEVTAAFVARAIEFIDEAVANDRPFYINLWPDDVHTPLVPPDELAGDGSKRQRYLGVLENMDRQLGRLFQHLQRDPKLRDNTLVLVTSDNGPERGAGSAGALRGTKGQLYEGGIREPLIVWAPGLMSADAHGTKNATSVLSSVDVVASLFSLAAIAVPAEVELDGEDLSKTLLGHAVQTRQAPLLWSRPPDRPGGRNNLPDLAIRHGQWKLLCETNGRRRQLYDLEADPREQSNLADAQHEVAQELVQQARAWHRAVAPRSAEPDNNHVFTNPIAEGADPWVVQHNGKYLFCLSERNRGVALHESDSLVKLGPKRVVWRAPRRGPFSREVWAPELHFLDGRWYIYVAASDGDNKNHLSYVLQSATDDPFSEYTLHGPLYTGDAPNEPDSNRWAIDATVLEYEDQRYLIWSGWETTEDKQWLYIARMKSPVELATTRVRLAANDDYLWERVGETAEGRGLHEAPQVLKHGDRTFVTYSCSGSWQPTYKLGLLELVKGGDPLNPDDWRKHPRPVFSSSRNTFGVGHASFVKSPDGREDWIVYHAKRDRRDGWRRSIFTQPFRWTDDGFPEFGQPVAAGELLELPSGTPPRESSSAGIHLEKFDDLTGWTYYGHHQLCAVRDGWLHLGGEPRQPINLYRAGEKLVVDGHKWSDLRVSATIRIVDGERDAGILFRLSRPAVGYDAQLGYFAGIVPRTNKVILGTTDGAAWRHLADATIDINFSEAVALAVTAIGNKISVAIDDREVLSIEDDTYQEGTIGLRVVDTEAAFTNVSVEPIIDN